MASTTQKLSNGLKKLLVGDFKQLLIFLILLFIFRPYNLGIDYIAIWHLFFTGVLLSAVFNCNHSMAVKVSALLVGIPTFILNWWSLFEASESIFIAALIASLVFLVFAIFSLLSRVLLGRVNSDVLRGTICVYFMIAFAFALLYILIELLYPNSFNGLAVRPEFFGEGHYHTEMVYFSFITILAIGYGDITPSGDVGQMLAVLEGIIGHFYLALIVARLVATYSMRAMAKKK